MLNAQPATNVTLTSTPSPSTVGTPVTLNATLSPGGTGFVTFYDGAAVLGIRPVSGGFASLTTTLLPTGTRRLRAFYAGDPTHAAATSSVIAQVVAGKAANTFVLGAQVNFGGFSPMGTLVADFNGDGKPDLAVALNGNNSVQVILGNADGTFQAPVSLSAGNSPWSIAAGDFNADGKADLAVANLGSDDVSILLGNGDGTFQPAVSYPTGVGAAFVAVADFNGDGKADLAVTNILAQGSESFSILLGRGDGTFKSAVNYVVGSSASSLAMGDFDGDGKVDIAYAAGAITIFLGNGDGTFRTGQTYSSVPGNLTVVAADFNGDGKLDLAIDDIGAQKVGIALGNGDGTFQPATLYAVGGAPQGYSVGDLNGDGKLDVAVAVGSGQTGSVAILVGNGDGTLMPAVTYAVPTSVALPAIADFNGDGRVDIVLGGFGTGTILLGFSSSSLLTAIAGTPQSAGISSVFTTSLQVKLTDSGGKALSGVTVTFAAPASGASAVIPQSAVTNASGVATVAATANGIPGSYSVTATVGSSTATFSLTNSAPVSWSIAKSHAGTFAPGQSGRTYTITTTNAGIAPTAGTVTVTDTLPNGLAGTGIAGSGWSCTLGTLSCTRGDSLGAGSSYPSITVTVNVALGAASPLVNQASVSGGGTPGAVVSDSTLIASAALSAAISHSGNFLPGQIGATYTVQIGNGALAGPAIGTVIVTETVPVGLTLVSMAGLGWTCGGGACSRGDTLAAGAGYPPITVTVNVAANAPVQVNYQVSIAGGGSPGASANDATTILPMGSGPKSDFNRDGTQDVIWQDTVSGLAQVWFLGGPQGTSVIGAATLTASNTWRIVGVGDFNRDGQPDVVWQDPVTGAAQVWFLGGPQGNIVTGAAVLSTGNSWRIMSIADFDGDGQPDCIWQDPVSGQTQIWFMGGVQGASITGAVNLTASNSWRIAGTGDFNQDGHPDVLWQDPVSGATQVWYLGGAQGNVVLNAVNLTGGNGWRIASVTDFNGDGHPDVVWQDPVSGASQVWFLGGPQGTTVTGAAGLSGSNAWRIAGPR